jgi:hypothetical protein
VAAAALIPVLAGCEAGNNAPTLSFHFPTDAAGTTVGDLAIRNVFVLGAPLGRSLSPGQSASVFLALVALRGGAPDTLMSVTAPGTAASVTLLPGSTPVAYGHPVYFTGPRPEVVLTNLTRTVTSGSSILLTLTFQRAGPITLPVPVFARAAHLVTYAPPQPIVPPTATIAVAAGHRPSARHHAHASPSPSPGAASPSPSPAKSP